MEPCSLEALGSCKNYKEPRRLERQDQITSVSLLVLHIVALTEKSGPRKW